MHRGQPVLSPAFYYEWGGGDLFKEFVQTVYVFYLILQKLRLCLIFITLLSSYLCWLSNKFTVLPLFNDNCQRYLSMLRIRIHNIWIRIGLQILIEATTLSFYLFGCCADLTYNKLPTTCKNTENIHYGLSGSWIHQEVPYASHSLMFLFSLVLRNLGLENILDP
jgi:hypothetical protein